jgi:ribose transport system substrate-binding protein
MKVRSFVSGRSRHRLAALAAVVFGVATLGYASSGTAFATASTASTSKCGVVPAGPLNDPENVVATLPKQLQAYYQGLPYAITKSAYSHWKPKHGPPWTIAFLDGPLNNPYNIGIEQDMAFWAKKLEADGLIKSYIFRAAPDFTAGPQIQQFESLIEQKVDLIIVQPNSTTALVPVIEAAYKAGIPTVTTSGVVGSPYAVNWDTNPWLNGAVPTAYIAKYYMHSKGNMLMVEGEPTQPQAIAGLAGAEAALRNCPNIKVINSTPLDSQYSNSVAKSVVLQFLASYHGTINGVFDGGVVSTGIISAFRQLGKPVPPMTNLGAIIGGLAYFYQHKSTWAGAATGSGGYEFDRIPMDIAIRILEGKGPKINDVIGEGLLVTKNNIDTVAAYNKKVLNVNNINVGQVPPYSLETSAMLNGYFNSPGMTGPVGLDKGIPSGLSQVLQAP